MAIYRMLRDASFGADEVIRLSAAYEYALQTLRLKKRTDPVTEIVAKRIIEVAGTGEKDPVSIAKKAIRTLGIPDSSLH